jgi:hypothetical protein
MSTTVASPSRGTSAVTPDRGELLHLPAKDLVVLKAIQREPSPARVRQFQGDKWDEAKTGILQVGRITDGEYKGKLHIVDGGTRWKAKMEDGDVNYMFACYVRPMSFEAAAKSFLAFNKDSMKPSAFAKYAVGVRAGEKPALAVKKALESIPLTPNPSVSLFGDANKPGDFAAFAAADRIVQKAYGEDADWDKAAELLAWSIQIGRGAYPQNGQPGAAHGHDADTIQAIAKIGMANPLVLGDSEREKNLRHAINTWLGNTATTEKLFKNGEKMEPSHWKIELMRVMKNHGGSSSRGNVLAKLFVTNHNRAFKPQLKSD